MYAVPWCRFSVTLNLANPPPARGILIIPGSEFKKFLPSTITTAGSFPNSNSILRRIKYDAQTNITTYQRKSCACCARASHQRPTPNVGAVNQSDKT